MAFTRGLRGRIRACRSRAACHPLRWRAGQGRGRRGRVRPESGNARSRCSPASACTLCQGDPSSAPANAQVKNAFGALRSCASTDNTTVAPHLHHIEAQVRALDTCSGRPGRRDRRTGRRGLRRGNRRTRGGRRHRGAGSVPVPAAARGRECDRDDGDDRDDSDDRGDGQPQPARPLVVVDDPPGRGRVVVEVVLDSGAAMGTERRARRERLVAHTAAVCRSHHQAPSVKKTPQERL
jgi:hypothetical protein